MVAGGVRVNKDVMPYTMVSESPLSVYGLNKIGLKRKGFSADKIKILGSAYKIFFNEGLMVKEAVEKIRKEITGCAEIEYFIAFALGSLRGITR